MTWTVHTVNMTGGCLSLGETLLLREVQGDSPTRTRDIRTIDGEGLLSLLQELSIGEVRRMKQHAGGT